MTEILQSLECLSVQDRYCALLECFRFSPFECSDKFIWIKITLNSLPLLIVYRQVSRFFECFVLEIKESSFSQHFSYLRIPSRSTRILMQVKAFPAIVHKVGKILMIIMLVMVAFTFSFSRIFFLTLTHREKSVIGCVNCNQSLSASLTL